MNKFCGNIGFVKYVEKEKGIYSPQSIEKRYFGDKIKMNQKYESTSQLNDNIRLNTSISVIADKYLRDNIGVMKYVCLDGQRWTINTIDDTTYPRILLTLGGLYNE